MAGQDNHVYGFNKPDSLELLQMIGGKTGAPSVVGPGLDSGYIVKTPVGGIAARSGSSVSSATCDVYYVSAGVLTTSGVTVPVYNLSTTAVTGEVYAMVFSAGGVLFAWWEDC